jgi:hypothetical protein
MRERRAATGDLESGSDTPTTTASAGPASAQTCAGDGGLMLAGAADIRRDFGGLCTQPLVTNGRIALPDGRVSHGGQIAVTSVRKRARR